MNITRAADVLGINRAQWELRNMVRALGLMSYLNTPDDEIRRAAGAYALRHWKAFCAECNARRDAKFSRNRKG